MSAAGAAKARRARRRAIARLAETPTFGGAVNAIEAKT
jgi:hypothetical protein